MKVCSPYRRRCIYGIVAGGSAGCPSFFGPGCPSPTASGVFLTLVDSGNILRARTDNQIIFIFLFSFFFKLNSHHTGARIAQLVERAPICGGLLLDAAGPGSTQTCGPLLRVIPPSLSPFMFSDVL